MEDRYAFWILQKDVLITVEGYFKPEEWTDSKSGEKRNRIVMVATKFYPAPEKEEEKPDQPKQKAVSKKKKASKWLKRPSAAFFCYISESVFAFTQYSSPPSPSSEWLFSFPVCP